MSWEAVATFALVAVTFIGLNAAVLRWMFDRHQEAMVRDGARGDRVEHQVFEVRATLPLEYVRREDWIRFCGTFDAKLDAMRDEMREEIGSVKEKLYV